MKEYIVQSQDEKGVVNQIAHTVCEETGDLLCKFLDKKKAKELLSEEKQCSPEYRYRILTITKTFALSDWE